LAITGFGSPRCLQIADSSFSWEDIRALYNDFISALTVTITAIRARRSIFVNFICSFPGIDGVFD